ncbi:LysR family transcriptional regulator [Nocardioides nitrophenolicus]|uniref:LysR family transcriptional regulator n=1 Tax=Nocardioides nitrophenolicus TaxID=60489 RepID=UPI00195940E4|nr:LysR family transcriptional regulator [Nocardioides nitrophenolicus]MBM7517988.1 DNA-binding transcriptional LysR family regulator [Nocardioides nitrophenolicus]
MSTTRRPDLDDLEVLALVARTGSIGQAAQELRLSQPSVSRRMLALERRLGVTLLHRSTQGTTLTAHGRLVVDWAAELLGAADRFTRSVATLRAEGELVVRAAVSMTIAEHYAPAWLARLHAGAPDLEVALTVANSTEVERLVRTGAAELGFVEVPSAPDGMRGRQVGTDELIVAVAPGHPWAERAARAERVGAAELATGGLLVREEGSGTRVTLEEALRRAGHALRPGLVMASNNGLTHAAIAGLGPVALSERALEAQVRLGELRAVPLDGVLLRRPLTAIWPAGTEPSEAAVRLLASAEQAFARPHHI